MSAPVATPSRPPFATVAVAAAVVALLVAHAVSYLPFIADDALISLRYAERLLDGQGLTWTDGERLEGYSNLLWILLCAGLGALGLELIPATRVLGIAAAVLAVLAVLRAHPARSWPGLLPGLAGGAALALSGSLAVWSVGGLEQPLLAALLAWAVVCCYPLVDGAAVPRRGWLAPGALLALLCWTRPDGPLFTAGVCAGILAARGLRRESIALCARLALLPVAAVLLQLGFRMAYYGDWIPNSAYAKLGLTARRFHEGLHYVAAGLARHAGLALPALLLAFSFARRSARIRLLLAPLLLWTVYVVLIGGDIFPARRHLVPLVVLLALLLAEGLARQLEAGRVRGFALAAVAASLVLLAWMQLADPQNLRARSERWEWDDQVVGNLLREGFAEQRPLLAVDPGGTLPYFSKLPAIDMLGINDRHLARNRPDDFGRGHLGHELGDGAYVLDRQPDLVVFCGPAGGARPCFRSGKQMVRDPRFAAEYRLVTFEGVDPYRFRSRIWVRAAGRVGIERQPRAVSVPGLLLAANPRTVASPDATGRIGAVITAADPAAIAGLRLPPGRWTVEAEAEGGPLRLEARDSATRRELARGTPPLTLEIPGGEETAIDLLAAPADPRAAALRLYRVTFAAAG